MCGVSPSLAAAVLHAFSFPMTILTLARLQFVAVASVQEVLEKKTLLEEWYGRAVVDLGLVVIVPVAP